MDASCPHSKNGDSAESVQGELEEIQQKVGLWGYLMLITYQVSPSLKPLLETSDEISLM